jgi:hypothetical protein
MERLIHAHRMAQVFNLFLGCKRTQGQAGGISRQYARDDKDEHGESYQHQEGMKQPANKKTDEIHGSSGRGGVDPAPDPPPLPPDST